LLRSLIVQLKIVPLPVFLEAANDGETRAVIISLGHCIRNNAATNISTRIWIAEITESAATDGCSYSTTTPSKN